jgi:hypothetical protein
MRRLLLLAALPALACRIETAASGRPPGPLTEVDSLARVEQDSALTADVEATLRAYYARFSARDWHAFRQSFWPGGTIATRWTPPGERRERVWVQSVDDFARRAADGPGKMAVFGERMMHAHVTGYGDMAEAWVVYEGRWGRSRDSVRTVRGVDAFHLYRLDGEWRIVALTFTPEQPARPLTPPSRPSKPRPRAAPARRR